MEEKQEKDDDAAEPDLEADSGELDQKDEA